MQRSGSAGAGKAPGILVGEADGKRCLDAGFLFVAVGADVGMLARGGEALAAKFKQGVTSDK